MVTERELREQLAEASALCCAAGDALVAARLKLQRVRLTLDHHRGEHRVPGMDSAAFDLWADVDDALLDWPEPTGS